MEIITSHMKEVLEAFDDGLIIQSRHKKAKNPYFYDDLEPNWNFQEYEFRIKPNDEVLKVNVIYFGDNQFSIECDSEYDFKRLKNLAKSKKNKFVHYPEDKTK